MILHVVIPGKPKGKVRARSVGARRYNDEAYEAWRHDVWTKVRAAIGDRRVEGAFAMDTVFYTPSGKSRSDVDNCIGAVLDALQDVMEKFFGRLICRESRVFENDRACLSASESFVKSPKERGKPPDYYIEIFLMPAERHLADMETLRQRWREEAE